MQVPLIRTLKPAYSALLVPLALLDNGSTVKTATLESLARLASQCAAIAPWDHTAELVLTTAHLAPQDAFLTAQQWLVLLARLQHFNQILQLQVARFALQAH
jgi:hypothetical protein